MSDSRHDLQSGTHGGHEQTDIDPRFIWLFYSGMAVLVVGMALFVVWMFDVFLAASRRADPAPSPVAHFEQPPLPRLQVNELADVQALRTADDSQLHSWGWISREQKVVHVPIARAIQQVVEHGPPNWPPVKTEPPPKTGGTPKAGDKPKADEKPKADAKPKADDKPKPDDAKAKAGKDQP